jgi:hypothetical protein
LLHKTNQISRLSLFSTRIHKCVFSALNRGQSAKIGLNWGGGRTKTGPGLHQIECKYQSRSCAVGPISSQYPSGANMLAAGSVQAHGFPHKSENDVAARHRRSDTLALGSFFDDSRYSAPSRTPRHRNSQPKASEGLMPDQHSGTRTAGDHHYRIKHLPLE